MARLWITVGDMTSSGGRVLTGSAFTDIDGKPVSRVNDVAICPLHKGTFPIVDGDASMIIDGQPVALHGSAIACGCKVLATQQSHVYIDSGGTQAPTAQAAAAKSAIASSQKESGSAFDQAIRFVSPSGIGLSNMRYLLHLADGTTTNGTTNESGETQRVTTKTATPIIKAELIPPETSLCCAKQGAEAPLPEVFPLDGITTTSADLGTSVESAKSPGHERDLTSGEIEMAKLVFGTSVDYAKVKVHNHGYWLFMGLQDSNTAVTPNGEMYFPKGVYKADYSTADIADQQWFIHEMTHVWQYQLGYPIKRVRGPRPGMSYEYTLDEKKKFSDYNMEAQGDLIADYFLVTFRDSQSKMNAVQYRRTPDIQSLLQRALTNFLANPSDASNLPTTTK